MVRYQQVEQNVKNRINMCLDKSSSSQGTQPTSRRDSFAHFMNKMAAWVLFLCVAACLVAVVFFAYGKSIAEEEKDVKITYVFQTDTTGIVTPASRMFADSILHEMSKHEQRIADKYEYIIEQKSNIEDYLTWGGILLTIVVSVFGFFGYKSLHDIEGKLVKQIEPSAQKAAEDKAEAICKNKYEAFETIANSRIEAKQTEVTASLNSYKESTKSKLLKQVEESLSHRMSKQRQDLYSVARKVVDEVYTAKFEQKAQDVDTNADLIESLQQEITQLKNRLDEINDKKESETKMPILEARKRPKKITKTEDPDPMNNPQNA